MKANCGQLWRSLVLAAPLLASAQMTPADETLKVPRYAFAPGQEMTFTSRSEFKFETGAHISRSNWTAWVSRKNDDGSFRVIFREKSTFEQVRKSQPQAAGNGDPHPDVTIGYCDVFDDGRLTSLEGLGYRLNPAMLFPKLPADAKEAQGSWERVGTYDTVMRYQSLPDNTSADTFVFEGVADSPSNKVYEASQKYRFEFDRKRGLLRRASSESTQGYGFNGKGTGTAELEEVKTHDAAWVKSFAQAADAYIAANSAYNKLTSEAEKSEHADTLLAKAKEVLKEACDKVEEPIFREQLDEQMKKHKGMLSYYASSAKERAEVLGKPSEEWETKDFTGKTHALKDYRGKVVLLDFWYRGCGWCIRAMPQLKELATDFEGQPVAILGMNTDRNEKDAQFVIEAMALNYPNLKAEGLPEKYHVRGFPTLVVVDQEGKVADIHVGYSPTLREEVAQSVKRLLDRK